MKNRVTIKAQAREFVRTGRMSPVLVSAIVLIIGTVLSEIIALLEYGMPSITYLKRFFELAVENNWDVVITTTPLVSSSTLTFLSVLFALVSSVLYAGYYSYCMGIRRGEEMPLSSLMDGLGIVGKIIWCSILMTIKIALWSMLFYIPGIIASYRYRFSIYNLLSDPTLSASQAIALSCRQTDGMKMDLFVLDLSFIGWELLTLLTCGILGVWTLPYTTLSDLGYYEEAQKLMGVTVDGGDEPKNDTPWEF